MFSLAEIELAGLESSSAFKPTHNIRTLKENKNYPIVHMKKLQTRYGPRIVVDLGEYDVSIFKMFNFLKLIFISFQVFLPARYSALSEEAVIEVNTAPYNLVYQGLWGCSVSLQIKKVA